MIKQTITFPKQSAYFLEQDVSFEQWQRQVICYRNAFADRAEQSWLLFVEDSYTFSLCFFALLAANKRIVLPPNGQPEQLKQCMKSADVFIGSPTDFYEKRHDENSSDDNFPFFDVEQLKSDLIANVSLHKSENTPLELKLTNEIIFFTSGSSGLAKAIVKTFEQLVMEVELLEKTFASKIDDSNHASLKINSQTISKHALSEQKNTKNEEQQSPSAIVMATVSHQHIYGLLFKLLWPIWSGRHLHLSAFSYPEHLVQQIKAYQQSEHSQRKICLISSPAYYHRLLSDNVLVLVKAQFSTLFSSGGPLNNEAAISLKNSLNTTPIEVFGSTETGGIAWRQRQTLNDDIWQTFAGIKCQNNNDEMRLTLWSPYLVNSNLSESAHNRHWYQTDDRVELIDAHRFKLLGRTDRIIKIEEKRCSLDELGLYLLKHHWVEQAYVVLIKKAEKRDTLAAVIVLTPEGNIALANQKKLNFDRQLKTHLKQYVEAIVLPRKFRYLDNLPYNSQGKLNKKQLEHLFD